MSNLKTRLAKHLGLAAVAAAAATSANAQIVHSGIVNIGIAATFNGLYLNVLNGDTNEPGNTGGATVPGWDVNFWGTTNFANFSIFVGGAFTAGNLADGATIGAASAFSNLTAPTASWNLNSDQNLVGFRFLNEGNSQTHYGWARISFGANTIAGRSVVEYAYDATPGASIGAGVVPAPSAMALLGLGGLVATRRRRA
jgi:hypothetical protein